MSSMIAHPLNLRVWDAERSVYLEDEIMWSVAGLPPDMMPGQPPFIPFLMVALKSPATKYIVEQFTGLKDSTGREIYEGDILDLTSQPEKICWYEVQWGTAPSFNPRYVGFVLQPIKKETKTHMFIPREWDQTLDGVFAWKVIGNIHESPHLLNA